MDPRSCQRAIVCLRAVFALMSIAALSGGGPDALGASLPRRNLVIQVRLVGAEEAARAAADDVTQRAAAGNPGYTAGTRDVEEARPMIQTLHVQNGQRGSLRFTNAVPIQWVEAVGIAHRPGATGTAAAGNSTGSAAGVGAASGAALVNAMTWIEAGQSLAVQPRWPGGAAPVTVDIEVVAERAGARPGIEPPVQERRLARSTLIVPLGRWMTFASVGEERRADKPGVWSTADAGAEPSQVFQVQVLAP